MRTNRKVCPCLRLTDALDDFSVPGFRAGRV
jgi:hypothetical protein